VHPRVSPGVLAGPIMLAWSSSLHGPIVRLLLRATICPSKLLQTYCMHSIISVREGVSHSAAIWLWPENSWPSVSGSWNCTFSFWWRRSQMHHLHFRRYIFWIHIFIQFHTSVDFVAVCIFIQRFRMVQNGSEWFFSAGSAVELLCSSMLVYGKFFVHGIHSTYTAYTAVLAQRRSTVAPNFGPLRHQSCQWLNMLWYVVAQCGTMWLTPRLPA